MDAFSVALANRETSLHLLVEFVQTEIRVAQTMIDAASAARVERIRLRRLAHAKRACLVAARVLREHEKRLATEELARLATALGEVCVQIVDA
jgi:hypothetical protein